MCQKHGAICMEWRFCAGGCLNSERSRWAISIDGLLAPAPTLGNKAGQPRSFFTVCRLWGYKLNQFRHGPPRGYRKTGRRVATSCTLIWSTSTMPIQKSMLPIPDPIRYAPECNRAHLRSLIPGPGSSPGWRLMPHIFRANLSGRVRGTPWIQELAPGKDRGMRDLGRDRIPPLCLRAKRSRFDAGRSHQWPGRCSSG